MHCLSCKCRRILLGVLWLPIGTRSCLLVVGLLRTAEALCPSLCLFGTILVTLCLMVLDFRVSRAEPMLSCWHDLLFLFCLLLFYLFLPYMGWLCGVGVFGPIDCSHSLTIGLSLPPPPLKNKCELQVQYTGVKTSVYKAFKTCIVRSICSHSLYQSR